MNLNAEFYKARKPRELVTLLFYWLSEEHGDTDHGKKNHDTTLNPWFGDVPLTWK